LNFFNQFQRKWNRHSWALPESTVPHKMGTFGPWLSRLSRNGHILALPESTVPMHPQLWQFTLQLFLDFRAIFSPELPLNFGSSRFTK